MTTTEEIEKRLAAKPYWVFFWLIAQALYVYLCIWLASQFLPVVWDVMSGKVDGQGQLFWLILSLPKGAVLVHLMLWNQQNGIGPLAGEMTLPEGWPIYAIAATPILYLTILTVSHEMLAGGDPNWAYGEDGPPSHLQEAAYGISMFTCVVLLAPFIEEIVYRGVAMGFFLGRGARPWLANGLAAILFTAIHTQYQLPALVPVFLMSLYFGWLRIKTGSVFVPLLAHTAANMSVFVIGYLSFGS